MVFKIHSNFNIRVKRIFSIAFLFKPISLSRKNFTRLVHCKFQCKISYLVGYRYVNLRWFILHKISLFSYEFMATQNSIAHALQFLCTLLIEVESPHSLRMRFILWAHSKFVLLCYYIIHKDKLHRYHFLNFSLDVSLLLFPKLLCPKS